MRTWLIGGDGTPPRVLPPDLAALVDLPARMAASERAMDRSNRHALLSSGPAYAAAIRRSTCGTLTCTYRAVQVVRGIPLCGPCGDALTADITDEGDDA